MLSNTLSLDKEEAVQADLQKLHDGEEVNTIGTSSIGIFLMTCIGKEGAYYKATTHCSRRRAGGGHTQLHRRPVPESLSIEA